MPALSVPTYLEALSLPASQYPHHCPPPSQPSIACGPPLCHRSVPIALVDAILSTLLALVPRSMASSPPYPTWPGWTSHLWEPSPCPSPTKASCRRLPRCLRGGWGRHAPLSHQGEACSTQPSGGGMLHSAIRGRQDTLSHQGEAGYSSLHDFGQQLCLSVG